MINALFVETQQKGGRIDQFLLLEVGAYFSTCTCLD